MNQKNKQPPTAEQMGEILLEWKAPLHPDHEKTWKWYATTGALALLCILYSVFTASWTFTGVLFLSFAIYVLEVRKEPYEQLIALREHGYQFGDQYFSWLECEGFWLLQGHNYVELHIQRKAGINRESVIQTGSVDFQDIRVVLTQFMPEFAERRERLLDMIIRLLKI